jgi:hypothetical protein
MKKLIKELADEAGFLMWDGEEHAPVDAVVDWSCSYDYELEKFAELIVKRCAEVADQYVRYGDFDIAELIRRDFGVKK